jgi:hypothetical protein
LRKETFTKLFLKNITPLSLLQVTSKENSGRTKCTFITEFNSLIHREIQNQPAPFIYERLGERYRLFLLMNFKTHQRCNGKI